MGVRGAEGAANAHLIAASPALYEALEPLVSFLLAECGDAEPDERRITGELTIGDFRKARAALVLARGEQPESSA